MIPISWVVSAILYRRESKRRNRPKVLRFYRLLPFAAWLLNILVTVIAFNVSKHFGH